MALRDQNITVGTSKSFITPAHVYWAALILISLTMGALALFVDPLYVIAGIICIVVGTIMVKYQFFGLVVYLAVFTLRIGEMYPALAALRLELLLGGSLSVMTLLANKYRYGSLMIPRSSLNTFFLFILVAMGMSLMLSACKDCTVDMTIEMVKLGIFFLMIILNVDTQKRLETFLWLFLILNFKLSFDIMWGYYHGAGIVKGDLTRASGGNSTMDNFNGIAITMNTLIPFTYYLFLHYKSAFKKIIMGGMLALFVWTMIITGSRGGLLGFCAILGLIWWQSKHKGVMAFGLLAFALIAWTVLGDASKERYMTIFSDDLDESSQGRIDSWIDGLQLFLTKPIFGVGAGAFAWARVENFGTYLNAHSLYIQVIAELGLVGITAYFCFIRDIFRVNWRTVKLIESRPNPNRFLAPFARATIITCGSMLVTGLFAHSAYRYTWYFMAAMTVVAEQIARRNEMEFMKEDEAAAAAEAEGTVAEEGSL
ncbi:MAG: O-antigen ligase family protein [bacterium]|nr:O-antigen ligase family protein [bacterium]